MGRERPLVLIGNDKALQYASCDTRLRCAVYSDQTRWNKFISGIIHDIRYKSNTFPRRYFPPPYDDWDHHADTAELIDVLVDDWAPRIN